VGDDHDRVGHDGHKGRIRASSSMVNSGDAIAALGRETPRELEKSDSRPRPGFLAANSGDVRRTGGASAATNSIGRGASDGSHCRRNLQMPVSTSTKPCRDHAAHG